MNRKIEILKYISKENKGIEIAPWHSPIAPKKEGYNCLILDVFDTSRLIENAKSAGLSQEQIDNIECVDIVSNSIELDKVIDIRGEIGTFDYIISSHNFEHIPNPIKFLRASGRVLKNNGNLSMAIPDKRACFDYFNPITTLGTWLNSYIENQIKPNLQQIFERNYVRAAYHNGNNIVESFEINTDPSKIIPSMDLKNSFALWKYQKLTNDDAYIDCHCSYFTPSSLRLLVEEVHYLGLSPFSIIEVSKAYGNEFFVHLINTGYKSYNEAEENEFLRRRRELLHNIHDECAMQSQKIHLF